MTTRTIYAFTAGDYWANAAGVPQTGVASSAGAFVYRDLAMTIPATDLQTLAGVGITRLPTNATGHYPFQGEPDYTGPYWVKLPTDTVAYLVLPSTIVEMAQAAAGANWAGRVQAYVVFDAASGTYPAFDRAVFPYGDFVGFTNPDDVAGITGSAQPVDGDVWTAGSTVRVRVSGAWADTRTGDTGDPGLLSQSGPGVPDGVIVAPVGSRWSRTDFTVPTPPTAATGVLYFKAEGSDAWGWAQATLGPVVRNPGGGGGGVTSKPADHFVVFSSSRQGLSASWAHKRIQVNARIDDMVAALADGTTAPQLKALTGPHVYDNGGSIPVWGSVEGGVLSNLYSDGFRVFLVNFKVSDMATGASGGLNSLMTAFINSKPSDVKVRIIVRHEPENDGLSVANRAYWCQMQAQFAKLVYDNGDPMVSYSTCHIPNSGQPWSDYDWMPALKEIAPSTYAAVSAATHIGLDPYPEITGGVLNTLEARCRPRMNALRSFGQTGPLFFPEVAFFNWDRTEPGTLTAAQQAQRIHNELWTWGQANNLHGFSYYDVSDVGNAYTQTRTLDTPEECGEYAHLIRGDYYASTGGGGGGVPAVTYTGEADTGSAGNVSSIALTIPNDAGLVPTGAKAVIVVDNVNGSTFDTAALVTGGWAASTAVTPAGITVQALTKTIVSGDRGATVTIPLTGGSTATRLAAAIIVIANPGTMQTVTAATKTTSDTVFTIPTFTPATNSQLWVAVAGIRHAQIAGASVSTVPTAWTERVDAATTNTSGNKIGVWIGTRQLGTGTSGVAIAAATGATASNSVNGVYLFGFK